MEPLLDSSQEPFRSRWGFHSIDHETFRKLRALHRHYWKTVRQLAAWFRWNAKQEQNRIRTERIRDDSGRVTGWRVLGPWMEPSYSTMFGSPRQRRGWLTIPQHLDDLGIVSAYRQGRKPVPRECVQPPELSPARIDELHRIMLSKS
jgi:hypothetical protein